MSRETTTEEFKTMARAVEAVLKKFPGMRRDIALSSKDPTLLILKIRKVRGLICLHVIAVAHAVTACNVCIYARDYY